MSNQIDDGGPAYPASVAVAFNVNGEPYCTDSQDRCAGGMSLRDWFAGQALNGMLSGPDNVGAAPSEYASDAYLYADAMIAARKVTA